MGEGPSEDSSNTGGSGCAVTAVLTDGPNGPVSLRFAEVSRQSSRPPPDDEVSVETHQNAVLEGPLPATLRWTGDESIPVKAGETFWGLTHWYAVVRYNFDTPDRTPGQQYRAVGLAFLDLVRARNPTLATRPLHAGDAICLPPAADVYAAARHP